VNSQSDGRFDRADFGRAENAIQLIEHLAKQIGDRDLLDRLHNQLVELAELVRYGASKGRE
jgi:hypothetical protein